MENLEEFEEKEFKGKIKNRCFLCGTHIDNNWAYYIRYGNCCVTCSATVGRRIPKHVAIKRQTI